AADAELRQARQEVAAAREKLADRKAVAQTHAETLKRLPSEAEVARRVSAAKNGLDVAQAELNRAKLTDEETTFEERLGALDVAVTALEAQLRETDAEANRLKGRWESSEGLHAKRAALAVRVEELTRRVEHEELDRLAVDRLYELFEECRDRQLGTLLEPVH